jgi:hypothetical protein
MDNVVYQHEAVQQLAKEFGLREITSQHISEAKVKCFLKAIDTGRMNPDHYPPAKWVQGFFIFLRQTGKYPEMLKSPDLFVEEIIQGVLEHGPRKKQRTAMDEMDIQACKNLHNLLTSVLGLIEINESAKAIERLHIALAEADKMFRRKNKVRH